MNTDAVSTMMFSCFFCGGRFRFGNHIYNGQHIARYQVTVCRSCYDGNWDGWAPRYETRLIAHLQDKAISVPARNAKGWLPRD